MQDTIIIDDEYIRFSEAVRAFGVEAENMLDLYIKIMERVIGNAISSGQVFVNLQGFITQAKVLDGMVQEVTAKFSLGCMDYIAQIDEADEYLY
jgi:hypothetical protein